MKTKTAAVIPLFLACILLLTGCVKLWREHIEQKTYLLSVERTLPVHGTATGGVLWIDRVNTLPPFNVRSFIIKKGGSEYVSSYYTELLISPSENVRNMFYNWFSASGLFDETTMHDRSTMTHRLSVSLIEMYGDDSAGGPRRAVVALKVAVFGQSGGMDNVLLNKTYRQEVETLAREDAAEADMEALNKAFQLILEACEADIAKVLQSVKAVPAAG